MGASRAGSGNKRSVVKVSLKESSACKKGGSGNAWISEFSQLLSLGRQLTSDWVDGKNRIVLGPCL